MQRLTRDLTYRYYVFANGKFVFWYYNLVKLRRDLVLYGDIGTIEIIKVVT